jgi:HK97 gp10 family phage protein
VSAGNAGDAVLSFDTKGITVMIKALNKVNKSPQKAVNKATSKANLIVKRTVKGKVPVGPPPHGGTLKRNIVTKAEKNHGVKGKKVREVTFKGGAEANAQLQKPIRNPGALGGKNPKAYYPASQEYGFLARAPGGGTQYVEGRHFMLQGAEQASPTAKKTMIDVMEKELDKLWQEAAHE